MTSTILQTIRTSAARSHRRIALADATDERMLRAAREATDLGLARITLVGEERAVTAVAAEAGVSLAGIRLLSAETFDARPFDSEDPHGLTLSDITRHYFKSRSGKVADLAAAELEVRGSELLFAALLAAEGVVDGTLAGSLSTTGDVIRAALRGIGLAPGVSVLSSMFLMAFPKIAEVREHEVVLAFADGAVLPDPTAPQLAEIAVATAATYQTLTGEPARVAMLSFSTLGSATSATTEKMIEAAAIRMVAAHPK